MFDALNRFISRLDTEPEQRQRNIGDDGWGFQVLRNKNPETPLEPWFDFIIGINGQPIVCFCSSIRRRLGLADVMMMMIMVNLRN